jgi:DNA-binding PucR family transcriptional regulator
VGANSELAIVTLREALEQRLDDLADDAVELIVAGVPAYRDADDRLRSDVREHVMSHLRASLESLGSDRDVTPEDLLFVRPHAARRARRVPVADFVRAFYVGERVLWDAALSLADDEQSRQAALAFASHLPRYFEVATTHAAEVYVEAQEQLAATGERIRRDLLEDLLTGRELEPGPRLNAARAVGLSERAPCLVISAIPWEAGPAEEQLLRGAAVALARATASRYSPLAVVRRQEIVVVVAPIPGAAPDELAARLESAQRRLGEGGLALTIGVSTVVASRAQIPDAYREAGLVRAASGGRPGVPSLGSMSAFEYLTLRPDPTASRLIAPKIHEFVAQDSRDGGQLIATLREYVACDLNGKRAAENLHIHVNTAHYRLARIAERTGCDLRRVADLIEILIAARLADARGPRSDAGGRGHDRS